MHLPRVAKGARTVGHELHCSFLFVSIKLWSFLRIINLHRISLVHKANDSLQDIYDDGKGHRGRGVGRDGNFGDGNFKCLPNIQFVSPLQPTRS